MAEKVHAPTTGRGARSRNITPASSKSLPGPSGGLAKSFLNLQRTAGNQAVQRMANEGLLQAMLEGPAFQRQGEGMGDGPVQMMSNVEKAAASKAFFNGIKTPKTVHDYDEFAAGFPAARRVDVASAYPHELPMLTLGTATLTDRDTAGVFNRFDIAKAKESVATQLGSGFDADEFEKADLRVIFGRGQIAKVFTNDSDSDSSGDEAEAVERPPLTHVVSAEERDFGPNVQTDITADVREDIHATFSGEAGDVTKADTFRSISDRVGANNIRKVGFEYLPLPAWNADRERTEIDKVDTTKAGLGLLKNKKAAGAPFEVKGFEWIRETFSPSWED